MFDDVIKEIETRCKNPLETQASIAESYANMIRNLDFISNEKVAVANAAVKARYPSKSGLARVKKLAWAIVEKRPTKRALDGACTCRKMNISGVGEVLIATGCPVHSPRQ